MDVAIVAMSRLVITHKNRRLSGLIRLPIINNDSPTNSPTHNDDYNSPISSPVSQPDTSLSQAAGAADKSNQEELEQPRRSSRRSSIISHQPLPETPSSSTSITKTDDIDVEKNLKVLKKIYLNKKVKKITPSLETIFEVPTDDNKVMSSRKFKRLISFQDLQKNKVKKLPMKAKQAAAKYVRTTRKNKISMDAFMEKINELDKN